MVLIVLLLTPVTIAERYTSPTQDGQFILRPLKAWGFIFALVGVDGSPALGSSGDALREARAVFANTAKRPVKVELLYLPGDRQHVYVTRTGEILLISAPPQLVWEVWGRSGDETAREGIIDVIGFLDFQTGRLLGSGD